LFSLVSHQACEIEAVDFQFKSLDTTSHSLTGEYADDKDEGCDEHVIRITHSHSKAYRRDLKQVVQEITVNQDGGIPFACKNWDGNSADTKVFKERAKALVKMVKTAPKPHYLVMIVSFIIKIMLNFYRNSRLLRLSRPLSNWKKHSLAKR
jgi:transposase